jgi:hypothetical protein
MYSDEFLMSRYEELLKEAERSLINSQVRLHSTGKKHPFATAIARWGSYLSLLGDLLQKRYGDPRTFSGSHARNKDIKV